MYRLGDPRQKNISSLSLLISSVKRKRSRHLLYKADKGICVLTHLAPLAHTWQRIRLQTVGAILLLFILLLGNKMIKGKAVLMIFGQISVTIIFLASAHYFYYRSGRKMTAREFKIKSSTLAGKQSHCQNKCSLLSSLHLSPPSLSLHFIFLYS